MFCHLALQGKPAPGREPEVSLTSAQSRLSLVSGAAEKEPRTMQEPAVGSSGWSSSSSSSSPWQPAYVCPGGNVFFLFFSISTIVSGV